METMAQRRERMREETWNAIKREYARSLRSGAFPDTFTHWTAFVHGWDGQMLYKEALAKRNQGGLNHYQTAFLLILFGSLLTGVSLICYFGIPPSDLFINRVYAAGVIGILMVLGSLEFFRKFREESAIAKLTHKLLWEELPEKPVD